MSETFESCLRGYYNLFALLIWFCFPNLAGVFLLAAAQDRGVGCCTGVPSEGHHLHPEVDWVGLLDQHISNWKSQGSQTRIQYLAKGRS